MAPEYLYEDPETGKVVSVIQGIDEDHTYEEDGKKFDRVFTSPNASIDTKVDAFSKSDFLEKKQENKKLGTVLNPLTVMALTLKAK